MMFRLGEFSAVAALVVLAGVAAATVGSKLEQKYGGPLKDLNLVQQHVNLIRSEIDAATASDLVASSREVKRVVQDELPGQMDLALKTFEQILVTREFSAESLNQAQRRELLTVIQGYGGDTNELTPPLEPLLFRSITLCVQDIVFRGGGLMQALGSDDESAIQVARAELTLSLARFDTLMAYTVILTEKS